MRRVLRMLSISVAVCATTVASAAAAPVGFQTDLSDGQHIECSWSAGTLACLNYNATATKACDAGGAVLAKTIRRTGAPKTRTYCVDEGFHGWQKLKAGRTWKRGGVKCRVRQDASALTCSNATGKYTIWVIANEA